MKCNFFWFRRDLRLDDNAGLYHALKQDLPVIPIFIFDDNILKRLEDRSDARVTFIHDVISEIKEKLKELGSDLMIKYGDPIDVWTELVDKFDINAIYCNRDYESYAINRDQAVEQVLRAKNASLRTFKDHVIFEKDEVLKDNGEPYTVFTPYKRKWLARLDSRPDGYYFKSYPCEKYYEGFIKGHQFSLLTLNEMNFERSAIVIPNNAVAQGIIRNYEANRNFPGIEGTSRLGIHFRFGTISIREKARKARKLSYTFLNELIWRDFYSMILSAFPHVEGGSFRAKYDRIEWRNNEKEFKAWCEGKTGYKIVDAGMRELNASGHMHNRVRMITASFLTKHLLIDWRWGEAYFASKLLDFELASNNGGWQWASGSGTDAAPYFRIFNPYTQLEKFDKQLKYVNRWVPEHNSDAYPREIVDHKQARERCLRIYKEALSQGT